MKEKDYPLSIDVNVVKHEKSGAKRRYFLKIYGHPITDNPEPTEFDLSNMRDEQTLRAGKSLLDAIWNLVAYSGDVDR